MDKYIINGGNKTSGSVRIDRAKNSLLPIIAASVAVGEKCFIEDFPHYSDTETMLEIVRAMGGKYRKKNGGVEIDASGLSTGVFPPELFSKIRASVFMLGAVISRTGYAETVLPGGCNIGARPVDIHIYALNRLGVETKEENGRLVCRCEKMKGADMELPFPSVGATENAVIAASVAEGTTVIKNAAREPEIADVARFLNNCGAKISGAGSPVITIEGVKRLTGTDYLPLPDRIEAGTFLLATVLLGGETEITGCGIQNISAIINKTEHSACKLYSFNDKIYIKAKGMPERIRKIVTAPYPGYPTDLQSQTAAVMSVANGSGVLTETVFPSRFGYASQLKTLGADITVKGNSAYINGVKSLTGGEVYAEDLRGGAGLTLACLKAEGRSVLHGVEHIDRGYDRFEEKLSALGLDIKRVKNKITREL